MKKIVVHTDGACEGNPGPGGWAAILQYQEKTRELSGADPATTNNRMELQAALSALAALREPCVVELFTDSIYLREGIINWISRWKLNGWRTVGRQPVKNGDLWKALDAAAAPHQVLWRWIKGHAGHPQNERCDALARAAIVHQRKLLPPEQLAAALANFKNRRDLDISPPSLFG